MTPEQLVAISSSATAIVVAVLGFVAQVLASRREDRRLKEQRAADEKRWAEQREADERRLQAQLAAETERDKQEYQHAMTRASFEAFQVQTLEARERTREVSIEFLTAIGEAQDSAVEYGRRLLAMSALGAED